MGMDIAGSSGGGNGTGDAEMDGRRRCMGGMHSREGARVARAKWHNLRKFLRE